MSLEALGESCSPQGQQQGTPGRQAAHLVTAPPPQRQPQPCRDCVIHPRAWLPLHLPQVGGFITCPCLTEQLQELHQYCCTAIVSPPELPAAKLLWVLEKPICGSKGPRRSYKSKMSLTWASGGLPEEGCAGGVSYSASSAPCGPIACPLCRSYPDTQCSHTTLEWPGSQRGESGSLAPLPSPPMGIVLGKLLLPPAWASHMLCS